MWTWWESYPQETLAIRYSIIVKSDGTTTNDYEFAKKIYTIR